METKFFPTVGHLINTGGMVEVSAHHQTAMMAAGSWQGRTRQGVLRPQEAQWEQALGHIRMSPHQMLLRNKTLNGDFSLVKHYRRHLTKRSCGFWGKSCWWTAAPLPPATLRVSCSIPRCPGSCRWDPRATLRNSLSADTRIPGSATFYITGRN